MNSRTFSIIATAVVTAILTSAFWIFAFNIAKAPSGPQPAGKVARIDTPQGPEVAIAEGVVVGPAGLAIPVAGIKPDNLVDTFTQARAGGARVHDAIDIMAAEGTPVVAAADGKVEKLYFSDGGGGVTAYVRSPDGLWSYYYAHLQGYAPGLAEGQQVRRGQLIGRVGHTGNANPAGPHLHFAINRMQQGQKWYDGEPVNPYPLLAGKKVGG
ncbi:M23 family metallopeptidase [Sphingomonas sinipercae]|uniref:M23 family metallopeptidase n=1 Tax=Sphingomonas sinipercae TaxID=2714944 RepID=A0A6G7ZMI4_9SPHN|nr:M23 family metallopeptidase [Sphingomonas sinipercae]QIL02194.1 M23 family metallopeptidase [Sphingomonas sinipercae]